MKFKRAKNLHRAKWVNAPAWGLARKGGIHDEVPSGSVLLTLEDHGQGGFLELAFTVEDARGVYFDTLIEHLTALRTAAKGSKP